MPILIFYIDSSIYVIRLFLFILTATNKNLRVDQFTKMSNEPDNGTTAQQRRDMLTHVILPRFLPQRISAHLHATELHLLHEIVKNLEDLSEMVPKQTVKLFQSLRRIHNEIELNADTISSEINKLRPGDSFAIFVRRQRWMFMIHAPPSNDESAASTESEEVILATFPGNVRPSEIYKPKSDISVIIILEDIFRTKPCIGEKFSLNNRLIFHFPAQLSIQCDESKIHKDVTFESICSAIMCPVQHTTL